MKFSEERIRHLSHTILETLVKKGLVTGSNPEEMVRALQKGLFGHLKAGEAMDQAVRAKIASLKRGVREGSGEWEILYRKYTEEEAIKRHR